MTWQAALCSPTAADSTALRPRLLPRGVAVVDLEPVDLLARDERVEPDAPSDGRLALHIARGDAVRVAEDLVHLFEREALRLGYLVGGSVSRPNNGVGRRGAERDAYEEEDEDATEKGEDLRGQGGRSSAETRSRAFEPGQYVRTYPEEDERAEAEVLQHRRGHLAD